MAVTMLSMSFVSVGIRLRDGGSGDGWPPEDSKDRM